MAICCKLCVNLPQEVLFRDLINMRRISAGGQCYK